MSIRLVPTLICDGCGAVIDMDFYHHIQPADQSVVPILPAASAERTFCCEACLRWWEAQYPTSGAWGPAWDERDAWARITGAGLVAHVRTTHDEEPLVDVRAHFEDPEPLP